MGWLVLLFRIVLCLNLLLFHFASSSSSHSLCQPDQSSALLQFKNSFITTPPPSSYCDQPYPKTTRWENGTDCCSWVGVTCDTISGHVIGLDLGCSGLRGTIHPNSTLFRLTHLQTLNLAFNSFSDSQLSSQFGGFVSLTHLNLSLSEFEGGIPSQISHLSNLASLDLSMNNLKWKESTWKRLLQNATVLRELVLDETDMSSIRPLLLNMSSSLLTLRLAGTGLMGNLTNDILCLPNLQELSLSGNSLQRQLNCISSSLRILDLSDCSLQGSIPPSFSNLTHLTALSLAYNELSGSIPSSLLTLPRLSFLYLHSNHLSGQIPNSFPQSDKFQELYLNGNKLSGSIPSSLSNLQHLTQLDLSSNRFSGRIPDVFGGLTNLETLDLFNNSLGGQLPSSLFDLTQLSFLGCSSNKLQGPLPNKITGFSNLTSLSLNDNLLNGSIPSWCLSLPSLTDLYLSDNQFTGPIGVVSSHSLEIIDLCSNKLEGNIPESISNLVNLTDLCLSSNNLSGPVNFQLFSNLQNLRNFSLAHNGLSSANLTEFPKLSTKFPALRDLDLSENKLNWLHEMDSLYSLNLSQNLFTSMDQFSRNRELTYLDLSFNLLAGDITSSICIASSLQFLNLSYNKLTGTIPQCLANLSSLVYLDLQMNKLYGTLPSTFPKKNMLSDLNLNGNQLEGPLPRSLSNCTQLKVLNLGNNQIEDTFPHWLQTLPYLRVLVLRANKFHSPIASLKTKHPFPSLVIFDISRNNFSGPLPTAYIKNFEAMMNAVEAKNNFKYMGFKYYSGYYSPTGYDSVGVTMKGNNMMLKKIPTVFVIIDFSINKFEGEIPNVIGGLYALKGLNLSHNRLIGPIPESMGRLTNLESLDLSSNMLAGWIPTELISLNFLEVLNLSQNHLVGAIPRGKQFDTFSNDSYEGNLGLCGLPLSMKCNKGPELHSPSSPPFQQECKFGFGWKPVAIGYGCGMVFGVGLGCCVFLIGKPEWLVRMVGGEPNKTVKRRTRTRNCGRVNELVQMS